MRLIKCVNGDLIPMTPEEEAEHLQSLQHSITPTLVKAEAQRRIIVLTGASDLTTCLIKQLNANMRANELNDIRHERALSAEEEAEADALRALAAAIRHIRDRSDAIESMAPIPADYTADIRWA